MKGHVFCYILTFIIIKHEEIAVDINRHSLIKSTFRKAVRKQGVWSEQKAVALVTGHFGCGKTTLLLDYFKNRKHFYFSFEGLEENVAEKLFADRVSSLTNQAVTGWDGAFLAISKRYNFIIFDDITSILSYKRFKNSLYENMFKDSSNRLLIFFLTQPSDDFAKLADHFDKVEMDYFTVPEVMKLYPELSKYNILGLCAISGGITAILSEYNDQLAFEENLIAFLNPASAFIEFMPTLMNRYFRKPETYHNILHAIANGNNRISEIGKFTGYAYNKCDNYVSALVSAGIIKADKEKSKHGTAKTAYIFENPYFRIWYRYIYANRTDIIIGNNDVIENIAKSIIEKEIHVFHIQKSFSYVNNKTSKLWERFNIIEKIPYAPQTIEKDNFKYDFDAIHRNGDMAIFVKVFADPLENCKKEEYMKIEKAIALANTYYNSHVFIFSKRRFSAYAARQAPKDEVITTVEVDRLKF